MDGLIIVKKKILEAKTSAVLCWNFGEKQLHKMTKKEAAKSRFFYEEVSNCTKIFQEFHKVNSEYKLQWGKRK